MFIELIQQFSAFGVEFIQTFEYLGVFIISFLGSASVLFPLPNFLIVFSSGAFLNPFLVAIVAGFGSAIGELTGYGVGYGGQKLVKK